MTGHKEHWQPIHARPDNVPPTRHPTLGDPVAVYPYIYAEGVRGYVCRYEPPGQRKEIRALTYCRHSITGAQEWRWQGMGDNRPLYCLQRLTGPFAVLVEGEKCADRLGEIIYPVGTWCGGSGAWQKTDWKPLAGKTVLLWPDNDAPGIRCMAEIEKVLDAQGCKVHVLDVAALPPGGDCCDIADPLRFLLDNSPADYLKDISNALLAHIP